MTTNDKIEAVVTDLSDRYLLIGETVNGFQKADFKRDLQHRLETLVREEREGIANRIEDLSSTMPRHGMPRKLCMQVANEIRQFPPITNNKN